LDLTGAVVSAGGGGTTDPEASAEVSVATSALVSGRS
jgi:hypothetical protein